jgi:polar amino acid transport system ATP-binding protein
VVIDEGAAIKRGATVAFDQLTKVYGQNIVIDGLTMTVPAGQKVVIIGRSGSGKTTLLRLLMGLERPTSGTIEVDGELLGLRRIGAKVVSASDKQLGRVRGQIGMVFQQFNLFPHMTAVENIMEAPVHVLRMTRADARDRAMSLLRDVGLEEKASEHPARLSGGQQQRVAIARALAMRPRVMLFDEVTSALDPELISEVLGLIQRLASDSRMTMLIVTHEMQFARRVADRVVFMEGGRVVEDGGPDQLFGQPSDERTRRFLSAVLNR